ncbi:hypothetical protein A0H81_11532 [Grifola frondosa]|uniref:Uncharacterized protein n=1 Tax=Grifola frondosa TaxID=5627 RepID=A0A1C7LWY1_GRIFR|nr:hypothetical protein A0H81_11532 [Grifola frondosa]
MHCPLPMYVPGARPPSHLCTPVVPPAASFDPSPPPWPRLPSIFGHSCPTHRPPSRPSHPLHSPGPGLANQPHPAARLSLPIPMAKR